MRDGAFDADTSPTGENTTTAANSIVETTTGKTAKKRLPSTSMISIEAEDDERERDGDYGVAILRGEPMTVSTTAMTSLTFSRDHRSAALERSMRMTTNSVDNMIHNHNDNETAATSIASYDLSDSHNKANDNSLLQSKAIISYSSLPLSTGSPSKSTHLPVINYVDPTRDFVGQISLPTTALSTSVPQLPSMTTLALSTKKKTTGFWKKVKKVLA